MPLYSTLTLLVYSQTMVQMGTIVTASVAVVATSALGMSGCL